MAFIHVSFSLKCRSQKSHQEMNGTSQVDRMFLKKSSKEMNIYIYIYIYILPSFLGYHSRFLGNE